MANLSPRMVAVIAVSLTNLNKDRGDPIDVTPQPFDCNGDLLIVNQARKIGGMANELTVNFIQCSQPCRSDKKAVHCVDKIIAGSALHGPRRRQHFVTRDYLLHDNPCAWCSST